MEEHAEHMGLGCSQLCWLSLHHSLWRYEMQTAICALLVVMLWKCL
jgi:hypothetical protein